MTSTRSAVITAILVTLLVSLAGAGIGFRLVYDKYQTDIDDLQAEINKLKTADSENSSSSAIDTSDWKTYTSETWGYSIKYPSNYYLEENETKPASGMSSNAPALIISDQEEMGIQDILNTENTHISLIFETQEDTTLEKYFENKYSDSEKYSGKEEITLGDDKAIACEVKATDSSAPVLALIVGQDNTYVTLSAASADKSDLSSDENYQIMAEIIQSFRFSK